MDVAGKAKTNERQSVVKKGLDLEEKEAEVEGAGWWVERYLQGLVPMGVD